LTPRGPRIRPESYLISIQFDRRAGTASPPVASRAGRSDEEDPEVVTAGGLFVAGGQNRGGRDTVLLVTGLPRPASVEVDDHPGVALRDAGNHRPPRTPRPAGGTTTARVAACRTLLCPGCRKERDRVASCPECATRRISFVRRSLRLRACPCS